MGQPPQLSRGPRREDAALLRGRGRFVADLNLPGTLHTAFIRSPFAAGRLQSVNTAEAMNHPGVVAAFAAPDLEMRPIPGNLVIPMAEAAMARPPLADGFVRYVGEPLAVVIAESERQAVDAAESVDYEIEPTQAVAEAGAALAGMHNIFADLPDNIVYSKSTEVGNRSEWPVEVSLEFRHPRLAPSPIEGLAVTAAPEDGSLTIWCSHQAPHNLHRQLTSLLDLEGDLRIRVPNVGGAFGSKGPLYPEYVVVATAALRLNRPVSWVERRSEHMTGGAHGRGQQARITLAGDHDGSFGRITLEVLADTGAYPHHAALVPFATHFMATGAYRFEEVDVTTNVVATNTAPTGPYRGAGRPEACFAIERAVDTFARAIDMDPAEVRRKNVITAGQMPHTTPTGAIYDGGDYRRALDTALELAGESAVRAEQKSRGEQASNPIGLGMALAVDRAGGGSVELGEFGAVSVETNGSITVRTGSTSSGQGHETVWSRLCAAAFDVPASRVTVLSGDTAEVAEGGGTYGSRSTQTGAAAVWRTAERVEAAARSLAARRLEANPEDLRTTGDGAYEVVGSPGSALTLADLAAAAAAEGEPLADQEYFVPGAQTFPYAAQVAVVEVDRETGEVSVRRFVSVDDCGTILDPMIVDGQIRGALAQGFGQALYEAFVYRDDGQPESGSLADYLLPTAADMPEVVLDRLETPAPSNPLGVKGIGETGAVGAPAAIVNAVIDALAPYGVESIDMPLTPARVWTALDGVKPPA